MDNANQAKHAPRKKLWGLGLLLLFAFAIVGYYVLVNNKDRTINHDYYRILYEASNSFNENLLKLDRMHQYKESVASIRSLLPSYKRTSKDKASDSQPNPTYHLDNKTLKVIDSDYQAQLEFEDILPSPKKGFSQYLFADVQGNVLATVGGERTISIVDLTSINQQIQRKNKQFQFNFSDPALLSDKSQAPSLPTYSNHVDMKISYGDFRVYVFPFSLETPIVQPSQEGKNVRLDRLYLVGLLPQDKIAEQNSGHWNLSVLAVTVVSIVFMWTMLRLYLLPKNHAIARSYRVMTLVSSYLFYIVILSLVLAYFQMQILQQSKDRNAQQYAARQSELLRDDLQDVFSSLSEFQPFYWSLINQLQPLAKLESAVNQSQAQQVNQAIRVSLAKLANSGCMLSKGLLPGSASSAHNEYKIRYDCSAADEQKVVDFALSVADVQLLVNAFKRNEANQEIIDFYSATQEIELQPGESLATAVPYEHSSDLDSKLLSVFALNNEGNSILSSIIFQESNALPTTFNLSHRNYYKMVRDQRGWDLALEDGKTQFSNVYIQRLLNVNNGTRGTTISMPMSIPFANGLSTHHASAKQLDYIIAADVLLPSMTLGKAPPFDFSYMVVDRQTGLVLFHNDTNRSLVENLYYSSEEGSNLSYWLKAGLDQNYGTNGKPMQGFYHGQSGRFSLAAAPVDRWAIVIFYPDDSLQSFMTNQFMYISVTFCTLIGAMMALLYGIRQFIWTSALKSKLQLPAKMNIRLVMLVASVMFSASYCLFIFGYNIEFFSGKTSDYSWSFWLPIAGLSLATLVVYRGCFKLFSYPQIDSLHQTQLQAKKGSKRLIIAILIAVFMHLYYLHKTAHAPIQSLNFHYAQLACNWRNHERLELNSIGLSRFPNSITQNRIDPLNLLPIDSDWINQLNNVNHKCQSHASHVNPDDYPSLSSLVGATHTWQWINTYLFNQALPKSQPFDEGFERHLAVEKLIPYTLLLLLIVWAWFWFNTRLLWNRLYCPERFLHHIDRMTKSIRTLEYEQQSDTLVIECDTIKLNGIGLALLLRSMRYQGATDSQSAKTSLLAGFEDLYAMSPCLQKFSQDNAFLPNLKLNIIQQEPDSALAVQLWDIETCLEKGEFRQLLLDLIMELKSLTLSGQLARFTIFAGFHSLQRVKMKDPLALDKSSVLDHAEYLSWAECLMDFVVNIPDSFKQGIDWQLLSDEVANFPELQFLVEGDSPPPEPQDWSQVWKRDEEQYLESRWTTINYILLNAEAFYRFKWESCSRAEKLALFNLAKKRRLNPTNTQMIEHLALNGLIVVRKGHLDIVNHSFAHFVLNAETSSTLNQLVSHGEAGLWKSYRLPLGILVLMIIGGIALTSGESIYIVAASIAGVLGTIASVTNSANLLRGGSQD